MKINQVQNNPIGSEISKPSPIEDGKFKEIFENALDKNDKKQLLEACQQFESYFLNQMLQKMRNAIPKGNLLAEDPGQKVYQEMLDEKLSGEMAKAGGIGLAQMMYTQLTKETIKPQIDEKG